MARRRREVPADPAMTAEPPAALQGPEPQATLTVRGSADAVKKQLGVGEAKPEAEKKKDGNGHDEKQKLIDALRSPQHLARIKRQSPREVAGHCWDIECPITFTKIQDETAKGWGGGSYRIVVIDPELNKMVAGDTFDIPGEPLVPQPDLTDEERRKMFMEGQPKTAADLTEEGLDRRARVSAKMLEVEALESQLEDARARRTGAKVAPQQDNSRVDDLERRLVEAKHQAEIERIQRESDKKVDDLTKKIDQLLSARQKQEGPSETALILQQMQKNQEAADRRHEAMLTQMQQDKMNAVLDEIKAIKNKPQQQSNMLEMADAMLKMKKLFGWGEDDDEDDDTVDPDDDRPWYERALDKLGGKFGDKLLEKFTAMEEKGEKVDRERFMAEMAEFAKQTADAAVAAKTRPSIPAPAASQPLPAPPPPPPRPAVAIPPAPVTALPPPPPTSGAGAPSPAGENSSQAVVQPPAPAPVKLTLEQEIVIRVGGVLEMIERESTLRPNEYHWNYEGCYLSLPEEILEKVCAAADPVSMIDAFAIEHINPQGLADMKAKISQTPRMLAWLKVGHDELKTWWAEKQKDPHYDPFADDEEGGEE